MTVGGVKGERVIRLLRRRGALDSTPWIYRRIRRAFRNHTRRRAHEVIATEVKRFVHLWLEAQMLQFVDEMRISVDPRRASH